MPDSRALPLQKIAHVFRVVPHDVVGIELRSDGTRALRLKRVRQQTQLAGAATLDAVSVTQDAPPPELIMPASVRAVHAGLIYDGDDALAKLVNLPGHIAVDVPHVRDALGLKGVEKMRIGYQILRSGSRRVESSVLGAAIPESLAGVLPKMLTAPRPVPYTIELSQIAVLNAFVESHPQGGGEICALIVADTDYCVFAFLKNGEPLLMRRFPQGSAVVQKHIARKLGVETKAALGIARSGVLDLTGVIGEIITPLLRQITLSRDFVERHVNQPVAQFYLGGDPILVGGLRGAMQQTLRVTPRDWDPFADLGFDVAANEALKDESWTFLACLGSCLGMLNSGDAHK